MKKPSLITMLVAGVALAGVTTLTLPTTAKADSNNPFCGWNGEGVQTRTTLDKIRMDPNLGSMTWALEASGVANELSGMGPYTILAPNNDAFARLPPGTLEDLKKPENKAKLAEIVRYHVILGRFSSGDFRYASDRMFLRTLYGSPIQLGTLANSPGAKFNDNVNIVGSQLLARDGVVHVIDSVLMPPLLDEKMSRMKSDMRSDMKAVPAPK